MEGRRKVVFIGLVAFCKPLLADTVKWETNVTNEITAKIQEFQAQWKSCHKT
jgi:hypothetical protein